MEMEKRAQKELLRARTEPPSYFEIVRNVEKGLGGISILPKEQQHSPLFSYTFP